MRDLKKDRPIYVDDAILDEHHKLRNKNHKKYWIVKRTLDIILSTTALILLSPLFLILMLIIWIDDPHGSPLYKQIRVGRHGRTFMLYKFRTMVSNADKIWLDLHDDNEQDGLAFKIKDDPRMTRVGRFLRKTSIDEFPQLINVLKGEMTIVGPRPALPNEVANYDERQKMRLVVTPGLTCYWQVMPNRNDVSFDEWMELDVEYLGERTFWEDIKLMFKTIVVMFRGEGR